MIKGQKEHKKWKKGKKLTPEEAIFAQCYVCFHLDPENRHDCGSRNDCSLYEFSPYKGIDEGDYDDSH